MDAQGFDAWIRSFAAVHSRRRAVGMVLVGSLGLLGVTPAEAGTTGALCWAPRKCKRLQNGGKKCKIVDFRGCPECQICIKGTCHRTKHGKTCKKGYCQLQDNGTACSVGTCQGGVCTAPAG
jgi:hypothetical protein